MIDDNMTNILKNFASAGGDNPVIVDSQTGEKKVINAAVEKDAMKILLEGLDSQQRGVNQMPAQHKMAKNTATKHPASNYLVGGEEGEVPTGDEKLDEVDIESWQSKKDNVEEGDLTTTWAEVQAKKKDAKKSKKSFEPATTECPTCNGSGAYASRTCPDCHGAGEIYEGVDDDLANAMTNRMDSDRNTNKLHQKIDHAQRQPHQYGIDVDTSEWDDAAWMNWAMNEAKFGERKPGSDVHKKQSFKDIFKSMDEEHENMETRFKRELHDEMQNKALKKGANGKYDLSENTDMLHHELKAIIGNLTYFGDDIKHIQDEFNENNGDTFLVYAKKLVAAVKKIRATKGNA